MWGSFWGQVGSRVGTFPVDVIIWVSAGLSNILIGSRACEEGVGNSPFVTWLTVVCLNQSRNNPVVSSTWSCKGKPKINVKIRPESKRVY